ncbi:MAG: hypothetical protein Q7S22_00205 [Candidatus Micrarchaeota archaeon]|nr:hypothetical protein [Candidatus Micrarchaeota archaeon]
MNCPYGQISVCFSSTSVERGSTSQSDVSMKKQPRTTIALKHIGKLPSLKDLVCWIILAMGVFVIILALTGQMHLLNSLLSS